MGKATKGKKHKWGDKKKIKVKYISREDAMRRLGVDHLDFRRLCILKGIYPKNPTGKGYDTSKIYYSVKDVKFLSHEPLLYKFKELSNFMKRVAKLKAKKEYNHLNSLEKFAKPQITYDHLIKERYPTFQSALSDLDDCLTLMFMFSKLPSNSVVTSTEVEEITKLCQEFTTYVSMTGSLRKVFLSIKGIYYQARILNQDITWIVPYDFVQHVPEEVDFHIFKIYLTFYRTLMKFINYKLFHTINIKYPIENVSKISTNSFILNLKSPSKVEDEEEAKQKERFNSLNVEKIKQADLEHQKKQKEEGIVEQTAVDDDEEEDTDSKKVEKRLFDGLIFFISRECPKGSLEFVIKSFGGQVGWDGPDSPIQEDDERITHHVLDRPTIINEKKSRDYIQPQWVYDCVNAEILLPIDRYRPGKKLPPHLSPFVDYKEGDYKPKYAEEIEALKKEQIVVQKVEEEEEEEDLEREEERYVKELNAEREGIQFNEFKEMEKEEKPKTRISEKQRKENEKTKLKLTMVSNRKKKDYMHAQRMKRQKEQRVKELKRKREMIEANEEPNKKSKK